MEQPIKTHCRTITGWCMKAWMLLISIFLVFTHTFMFAAENNISGSDEYVFSSNEQAIRFDHLSRTFRCLVCQNQTLSDSDAPLARDLRRHLYELVQAGEDNASIIDYFTTRYGDFVLYLPPFRKDTLLLWLGPFILLLIGIIILYRTFKNQARELNQ